MQRLTNLSSSRMIETIIVATLFNLGKHEIGNLMVEMNIIFD